MHTLTCLNHVYHAQMRSSMVEREKERQREAVEKQQKAAAAMNKSVNIQAFRSFNLKGKDHQMKQFWSKRLFEVSCVQHLFCFFDCRHALMI
jgi:hypothetical protein